MRRGNLALMLLAGAVGLIAFPAPGQAQCVYSCDLQDGCFYCVAGASQEECHVACRVCWGFTCGPEPKVGVARGLERIKSLATIPVSVMDDQFEAPVRDILANVWSGFNGTPTQHPERVLRIQGKILIGDTPHDFSLRVAQAGDRQEYLLRIHDYGQLDLSVAAGKRRAKAEYSWLRNGGALTGDRFSYERPAPTSRLIVRSSVN